MTTEKTEEEKAQIAAKFLDTGWNAGQGNCIYFDDNTQKFYICDSLEEMVDLYDLLHSPDPYIRRDAYSHWCAQTTHNVF